MDGLAFREADYEAQLTDDECDRRKGRHGLNWCIPIIAIAGTQVSLSCPSYVP